MRIAFPAAFILIVAAFGTPATAQTLDQIIDQVEQGIETNPDTPAATTIPPVESQADPTPMTPPSTATVATENVEGPLEASYEPKKYAVLQTLDKVTARTRTITLAVGQPSAVGPIFIDVKTCQKTPPTEQPESAAFLQIWEAKPKAYGTKDQEPVSQWVFSGWMFASSPALSAMNHPIYDVWVKDCTNELTTSKQK